MVLDSREAVLANLARVRENIARACDRSSRDPAAVRLVAASKAVPVAAVRWAHEGGVEDFGENYVRELETKREAVEGPRWHFIGTLQSHTAHRVADLADVVQTLTPGNAVGRLSRRAAQRGRRIPALIEVDFTGERIGVTPQRCVSFADEVSAMDGLELRGVMTLPPMPQVPEDTRPWFIRLRELLAEVRATHPQAVELSMGMSMDYEVAVEEGATMVRVGTALFGERPPAGT
jgi:pyridoxal phosphate enzyme (YggS family)